jgi:hypothetical protein
MKLLGIICRLLAFVTFLAGALDVFRAIDPTLLEQKAPQLYQLPVLFPTLILGVITLILSIITRTASHSRGSRRFGTGGAISAAIIGCVLAGLSIALTNVFPGGIIGNPANESKAPISSNSQTAQKQIDSEIGVCATPEKPEEGQTGWKQAPVANIPGISYAIVCPSMQIAYVVFTNPTTAAIERPIVEGQAANLMQQYAPEGTELKLSDYRILSGPQWLAVSTTDSITKLQKAWGGEISEITPPDTADATDTADTTE